MVKYAHPLRVAASTVLISVVAGCSSVGSSRPSCPGYPEGVSCKSPAEVYEMTHGDEWRHVIEGPHDEGTNTQSGGPAAPELPSPVEMARQMALPPGSPVPVMEPAQAMRIWIAPWVDGNQDLHWPEYVFTEVTPRRWSWGEKPVRSSTLSAPVMMRGESRGSVFPPDRVPGAGEQPSRNVYDERDRRKEENPVPGVSDALDKY